MKPIKPNDLGDFRVVEWCQKIRIEDLVRGAKKDLKRKLVESQIEAEGLLIKLTTSKTRWGGERLWFVCPNCQKRVGIVFHINNQVVCQNCGRLKYKKQRYGGMMEIEL